MGCYTVSVVGIEEYPDNSQTMLPQVYHMEARNPREAGRLARDMYVTEHCQQDTPTDVIDVMVVSILRGIIHPVSEDDFTATSDVLPRSEGSIVCAR